MLFHAGGKELLLGTLKQRSDNAHVPAGMHDADAKAGTIDLWRLAWSLDCGCHCVCGVVAELISSCDLCVVVFRYANRRRCSFRLPVARNESFGNG